MCFFASSLVNKKEKKMFSFQTYLSLYAVSLVLLGVSFVTSLYFTITSAQTTSTFRKQFYRTLDLWNIALLSGFGACQLSLVLKRSCQIFFPSFFFMFCVEWAIPLTLWLATHRLYLQHYLRPSKGRRLKEFVSQRPTCFAYIILLFYCVIFTLLFYLLDGHQKRELDRLCVSEKLHVLILQGVFVHVPSVTLICYVLVHSVKRTQSKQCFTNWKFTFKTLYQIIFGLFLVPLLLLHVLAWLTLFASSSPSSLTDLSLIIQSCFVIFIFVLSCLSFLKCVVLLICFCSDQEDTRRRAVSHDSPVDTRDKSENEINAFQALDLCLTNPPRYQQLLKRAKARYCSEAVLFLRRVHKWKHLCSRLLRASLSTTQVEAHLSYQDEKNHVFKKRNRRVPPLHVTLLRTLRTAVIRVGRLSIPEVWELDLKPVTRSYRDQRPVVPHGHGRHLLYGLR